MAADDYPHSDNELEESLSLVHGAPGQSHSLSPGSEDPPQKPPRTYTTTFAQINSSKDSNTLFKSEGDDFSSDLMSTFERLGSVYSISGLLKEEMDGGDESNLLKRKIMRSVSAVAHLDPTTVNIPNTTEIPKIKVASLSFDDELEDDESSSHLQVGKSNLVREMSRSVGSLTNVTERPLDMTPTHTLATNKASSDTEIEVYNGDELQDDTLKRMTIEISQYIHDDDDDSSVDSYVSAEDRNEFLSRHPTSSPLEIRRPDSEASELFHTPPNSLSPSPTGLKSISPSQLTSLGLALGVNIKLEDSQSTVKRVPDCHADDITLFTSDLRGLIDHNLSPQSDKCDEDNYPMAKKESVSSSVEQDGISSTGKTLPTRIICLSDDTKQERVSPVATPCILSSVQDISRDNEGGDEAVDLEVISKTQSDSVFPSQSLEQYSDYDVHIIPDDISPSKVIF